MNVNKNNAKTDRADALHISHSKNYENKEFYVLAGKCFFLVRVKHVSRAEGEGYNRTRE